MMSSLNPTQVFASLPSQQGCLALLAAILTTSLFCFARCLGRTPSLRSIPGPARSSLLKGNLGQLFDQQGWAFHRAIVRQYGSVVKIHGILGDKRLYVSDPKALRHILIEDQDAFEETDFFTKTNLICFGPGIVSVVGEQHRKQRKLMGPVLSTNHLRGLTSIFHRISHELLDVLKCKFGGNENSAQLEIEMFHWIKRTALEVIGRGGLGYSFGSLDDSDTNEYSDSIKDFAPTLFRLSILRLFLPFFSSIGPVWLRRAIVRVLPISRVQRLREIVNVMDKTVREVYATRCAYLHTEDTMPEAPLGEGRDMTSILLRENLKSKDEDKMSDEEILGQMSTFIFAGQDTTSAALARILQTLAEHPDSQVELRKELEEAHGTDLSYDALHGLPFLDAVVRETLRLYPPVIMLHRVTTRDTLLPLSVPISTPDGKRPISAVPLRKNTNIVIAIEAANRRTDIFGADAERWRPERWLEYNLNDHCDHPSEKKMKTKLPGVYSGLLTFLGGRRSCIGVNFAILELKVMLATLIPVFHFALPEGKELSWKLGGIVSPGVKDDPVPKLPLRLSLVEKAL